MLEEVKIKIPKDIKDLVSNISESMYVEVLKEIALKKLLLSKKQLSQYKRKIAKFEKKYGNSMEALPDSFKAHEDYIEWQYLNNIVEELEKKIDKINILLKK